VRNKHDTMAEVLRFSPPNLSWHRDLLGQKLLVARNELRSRIIPIVLSQEQDKFHWNLHLDRKFSVKSHYLATIWSLANELSLICSRLFIWLSIGFLPVITREAIQDLIVVAWW